MAQQKLLKFGDFILSDPTNGNDGYVRTKFNRVKKEKIEIVIPNTTGRIYQTTGIANSDQTTLKMEFKCLDRFTSISDENDFLLSIDDLLSGDNVLDTVSYGVLNDNSTYQDDNMEMEFEFISEEIHADGGVWLEFRVTFTKWGY